ncbi:MAG TPA: glycine zipper domain-containing protein [Rhabdochlamydiaceae bacterium]|nr:glycine zipper domain-containing protein [Rhabdochlamydiaceae bacterium]
MKAYLLASTTLVLILSSCATKTQSGALGGAAVGALAGGLIGGNATGALIGGAVGAAGGALIGYSLDQQDRETLGRNSPRTLYRIDHGEQLSLEDIKEMSRNGLSNQVIINQIKATNSVFYLSTRQIVDLKRDGVSERVIDYMIETGT